MRIRRGPLLKVHSEMYAWIDFVWHQPGHGNTEHTLYSWTSQLIYSLLTPYISCPSSSPNKELECLIVLFDVETLAYTCPF